MFARLSALLVTFITLAALACFASVADAANVARVGKVQLAGQNAKGGPVFLVPVSYPISGSGQTVRIDLRSPSGKQTLFASRVSRGVSSGMVRRGERRKRFTFVHSIALPKSFAGKVKNPNFRFRVEVTSKLDIENDGKAESLISGKRTQRGLKRAPVGLCSTPSRLSVRTGKKSTLALPTCGKGLKWKVAGQPANGSAKVTGGRVTYTSQSRQGLDDFTLLGKGGGRSVRTTIQVQVSDVDPSTVSVRTMGDSVTAGFGYFGSTGKPMRLGQLDGCKPGATIYNDACSSNSSNTTNVGTDPNFLPDYGLSRNIAWPAEWANTYGITNFKNEAVSGSAPVDWQPGGQDYPILQSIEAENPDYIMMTLGANPLLSDMLFGVDNMGCAIYSDVFGDYKNCIETAFAGVNLAGRLKSIYTELVDKTTSKIVLMQYPLTVPSSAIAYSSTQIEEMGELLNEVIADQAGAVSGSRIKVVAPPRFNVGINMEPLFPSKYSCSFFGSKVDGQSVQSTPTQDELLLDHPLSFCSGPAFGAPWVISGDTGIHPSFVGHAQMASQIPPPLSGPPPPAG